jgi:hypothetical protein
MVRMWPANGKDVALMLDLASPIIATFFVATLIVSNSMCMLCAECLDVVGAGSMLLLNSRNRVYSLQTGMN